MLERSFFVFDSWDVRCMFFKSAAENFALRLRIARHHVLSFLDRCRLMFDRFCSSLLFFVYGEAGPFFDTYGWGTL
jgi:hypothetical protein